MPSKNRVKQYVSGGYYHCYNRGANRGLIFNDPSDHKVFLSYLREYLTPVDRQLIQSKLADKNLKYKDRQRLVRKLEIQNYSDKITLLAYCLMPNHFHLLLRQEEQFSIQEFMRSLMTRYTMYMNKKYDRTGTLFQGVYKGVLVITDEQLIYLSYYIHKQATLSAKGRTLKNKWPSSLQNYLGYINQEWINTDIILGRFDGNAYSSYKDFMSIKQDVSQMSPLLLD